MIEYSGRIPKQVEKEIRDRIDATLLISLLTPIQKNCPSNRIAVTCPCCKQDAHIYTNRGGKYNHPLFRCFHSGCSLSEGGQDIFAILKYIYGYDYRESLLWIADACGLAHKLEGHTRTSEPPVVDRSQKEDTPLEVTYIDVEVVEQYMTDIAGTNLYRYVVEKLRIPEDAFKRSATLYCIGGVDMPHWKSLTGKAVTFPQVDNNGNVVDIRIMAFKENGHRIKYKDKENKEVALMSTIRAVRQVTGYKAEQPLFGIHLAYDRIHYSFVAIVESEKTAIVMSALMPDILWVATSSMDCITLHSAAQKLAPVADMPIRLLPDRNAVEKWQAIADANRDKMNIQCCSNLITAYFPEYRIINGKREKVKDDILDLIDKSSTMPNEYLQRNALNRYVADIRQAIVNPQYEFNYRPT